MIEMQCHSLSHLGLVTAVSIILAIYIGSGGEYQRKSELDSKVV